uniref:Pelota N-terminal domain-containing protein n=1 Tax=Glossina pallidipes TaxID=7398 RepID=A0A1B0AJI3_GLOPL
MMKHKPSVQLRSERLNDFDTQACFLRLRGRNIVGNQYVKMGAYRSLDLELNRNIELRKREWDTIALDRIDIQTYPNI